MSIRGWRSWGSSKKVIPAKAGMTLFLGLQHQLRPHPPRLADERRGLLARAHGAAGQEEAFGVRLGVDVQPVVAAPDRFLQRMREQLLADPRAGMRRTHP